MIDEPDYLPLIEAFKRTGQMPVLWQWTAREFVCSANILRHARDDAKFSPTGASYADHLWKPHSAVWLLYGLALENLLKGLLVAQGIDATSTGKLNESLKTHNLPSLWKRANLPEGPGVAEILKNLYWSVEVGKYPVGTKPDAAAPSPFWLAVMNPKAVVALIETADAALRALHPRWTLEKRDLFRLCQ